MTKNILFKLFLAMGLLLSSGGMQAFGKTVKIPIPQNKRYQKTTVSGDSVASDEQYFDSGALVNIKEKRDKAPESLFPQSSYDLGKSHFTWGAEVGSSIDMTSHNMSTFDLDLNLGYKNAYFKVAGVGAGFHRSVSTGDTFLPVYALIRTSFRKKPSLFFLNLLGGYSFNTLSHGKTHGDFISSIGCGLNLTQSRHAKSYIILSACTRYFDKKHKGTTNLDMRSAIFARLQIGINF